MTLEEMEYRIKRIELALMDIQMKEPKLYLGIIVDTRSVANSAPEWDENIPINWGADIIHLHPDRIADLYALHELNESTKE